MSKEGEMLITDKIHFKIASFAHETLYGVLGGPYEALNAAGEKESVLSLGINPAAVEHVQLKIEKQGVTNAQVILADADRTGLPDQSKAEDSQGE